MINFICSHNEYFKDLQDLINLFEPHVKKEVEVEQTLNFGEKLCSAIKIGNKSFYIEKDFADCTKLNKQKLDQIEQKRIEKRFAKNALYFALSSYFKVKLPWGALTGVKPVSLIKNLLEKENFSESEASIFLQNEMFVSAQKINLALSIIKNQPKIISDGNNICIYINIPFCPERCSYCSFVSLVTSDGKVLDEYVDALVTEIEKSKILFKNKTITSIYFGGGTPSILNVEQLKRVLAALNGINSREFVFECGRADTLTREKLSILKQFGVTRICVNPQTFNTKVLNKINRHISNNQVFNAINLARNFGFIINCDLIAGLPLDTYFSFKRSVKILNKLNVDNISVHSLAIKRTSELFKQNAKSQKLCKKMLNFAIKFLTKNGYKPYYLYRLKNTFEGLENIGFCKNNAACLFNICSMDERQSIIAFGANGISKKIDFKNNFIDRVENPKDITTYTSNLQKFISRKLDFFK